jgi:hypothetical protein
MGLTLFRLALALGWGILLWITVQAGLQLGFDKAGDFFFGDMAHPWRAQFNIDFGFHLLLTAAWMIWSAQNRLVGLLCAVLAIMGGAVFTFAYLLAQTFLKGGNLKAVVLGRHYIV